MKVKFIFLLLVLLTIFGFTEKNTNRIPEGKWTMCKTICNGIETTANVCTEIILSENGQGQIRKPKNTSNFSWEMKDESIEFHFNNKIDKASFISKDSILYYQFFDRGKNVELQLKEENSKCKFILVKSK